MVKKNIFSISVALFIMYLSLAPAETFNKVSFSYIPHVDKIVHFVMYFTLMSVIIFENRMRINETRKMLFFVLIPVSYGIMMEVLQYLFTTTRTASIFDFLFNLTGVIFSVLFWLYIKSRKKRPVR